MYVPQPTKEYVCLRQGMIPATPVCPVANYLLVQLTDNTQGFHTMESQLQIDSLGSPFNTDSAKTQAAPVK